MTVSGDEHGAFGAELQDWGFDHGIDIEFTDFIVGDVQTARGPRAPADTEPPDIATLGQPGSLRDLARDGMLMDLGTYLDVGQLRKDYNPYLLSLGTVGTDGSWPAHDGALYGALALVTLKSLIWYPARAFERAGYTIPHSWSDLLSLSARMVADSRTPWCMGLEVDDDYSDGWPATDWIENLLLGSAGPEVYDRWTSHQIPFDDPVVRRAFERFGDVVFGRGNLLYGVDGAIRTDIFQAPIPMVEGDPPGCWLYHYPSFLGRSAGARTDAFRFPVVDARQGNTLLGGGIVVVALTDRPEVRDLMRFLLSPEFGRELAASGEGVLPANRRFDRSNYDPFWRRQAALLDAALAADTFRFDGSDLMPPPIGNDMFWHAMIRYLQQGPDSLDAILTDLEAAWPDDG